MKKIVPILFLFSGIFYTTTYILFSIIFFILLIIKEKNIILNKKILFCFFLCFIGIIYPLTIGLIYGDNNLSREYIAKYLIINFIHIYISLYIYSRLDFQYKRTSIYYLSFGLFINSIASVFFTISIGYTSGYGNVYNPFAGEFINSPAVSMNLIIPTIIFTYLITNVEVNYITRLLSFVFLILSIFGAFYLGGRTYFIVIMIIAIKMLFSMKIKNFFMVFYYGLLLFFSFTLLYENLNEYEFFKTIFNRLGSGIHSTRFDHYIDGIIKLYNNPFGGYSVDHEIEKVKWFHNTIIDLSRFGGWPTALALIILLLHPVLNNFFKNSLASHLLISCFLLFMTDVIIEANHIIILTFLMSFLYSENIIKSQKHSLK